MKEQFKTIRHEFLNLRQTSMKRHNKRERDINSFEEAFAVKCYNNKNKEHNYNRKNKQNTL